MKKYGLRIGEVGIEFNSVDERDKAIKDFTHGCDVSISDTGIRFTEGKSSFSIYDRDTKEVLVNCCKCKGVFGIDSCGERSYPNKHSWEKEYSSAEGYICDACLARAIKEKEVFDAKKVLSKE